ncbi:hypothetical protein R3P38DRAFT_2794721 [Favolaschia claudopus]|uniref:Uncharacterized protein n=1 Tax=Favolaschia claudopus TaxID=2862362 RepID=A0AAW0A8Y3_9AGAR
MYLNTAAIPICSRIKNIQRPVWARRDGRDAQATRSRTTASNERSACKRTKRTKMEEALNNISRRRSGEDYGWGISDPQPQPTTLLPTLPSSYHRTYTSLLWQPPQFLRTFIPTALSFEANYSASTTVLIVLSLGTLQPLLPEGMPGASPGMALAGALNLQPQPLPLPSSLSATPPYHSPSRYSCTLVVPDSVVGHIIMAVVVRVFISRTTSPAPTSSLY